MVFPVNVATCTVTGAFVNTDGTPAVGTVTFTPTPARILDVDAAPPTTWLGTPVAVVLDEDGAFTVDLPASDDVDLNPTAFTYHVSVRTTTTVYSFCIEAPEGVVDLAEVTPIIGTEGDAIVRGPAGPEGGVGGGGLPVGGDTGEVLAKLSGDDYDTDWIPASAPGVHASTHAAASTDPVTLEQSQITGLVAGLAAKQPLDSDLTAIAALAPGTDAVIQREAGMWVASTPTELKTSLTLTKSDVGLGNVSNTSDAAKPVSTATQTALDLKADKATTITPTAPLTGGGSLAANRTLAITSFAGTTPGAVPTSAGGTSDFLRADGTWATPPGGGAGISTEDAVDAVAAALVEGTGIDIVYNDASNTITVTATGSASAGITVAEGGSALDTDITTLDFGAGFDLTESPENEVNIALDFTEVAIPQASVTNLTTDLAAKAATATTVTATAPLTGSGTLGANLTLGVAAFSTSSTASGVVPGSNSAGTGSFLRADGTWALPPGAGGTSGHVSYTHNSTLTEPPATGQMRFNNANQLLATRVWLSQNDDDGLDVSIGLAKVLAGHQIYIQDYDNAANWIKYNVTAVSDDGAYYDFTVTYSTGPGGIPSGSGAAGRVEVQGIAPGTVGVPPGGATGEVLAKTSGADYAVAWDTLTEADISGLTATLAAKQPLDSDLTTIAGLTATTGNMILSASSAWTSATPATVKTALSLNNVDNTADTAKPVSTAQAAADALKADKTTTVTATAPLTGSGTLGANLTLGVGAASDTATGVIELATAAEVLTGTDTTRAVTAAGATGAFAPKYLTINAQTGTTYTLVLTDASKLVTLSNAGAITLSVPTNASVAFPVGTVIDLAQLGAGAVTVVAVTPGTTTVNGTPSLVFRAQYSAATLIKRATDAWLVVGDLATP